MIASGVRSLVLGALALGMAAVSAGAQDWPTRPIRFIVRAGGGGGTGIIHRIIAQPLSAVLGQPIYIENRQGAGNIVAASTLVNAPKDGYTAYMMNNSHGVSATLFQRLPYDSVEDFAMVSLTGTAGLVLVTAPDFPAKDVKSLIAAAKAAPGHKNFASGRDGPPHHFSGELFCGPADGGLKRIPYRAT